MTSAQRRPIADIDVETLATMMNNSEGGYYDPNDGGVRFSASGEVLDDDDEVADPEEQGWIGFSAIDSREGFRDMEDFAYAVGPESHRDRLLRALGERGPFRLFRYELSGMPDEVRMLWHRFKDARDEWRAIAWLRDFELVDDDEAAAAMAERSATSAQALELAAAWKPGND